MVTVVRKDPIKTLARIVHAQSTSVAKLSLEVARFGIQSYSYSYSYSMKWYSSTSTAGAEDEYEKPGFPKGADADILIWVTSKGDCLALSHCGEAVSQLARITHNPKRKRGLATSPLAYRLVDLMDLGSKNSGNPPRPRAGGGLDWVSNF